MNIEDKLNPPMEVWAPAMDRLRIAQREVIILRSLKNLPFEEIGPLLGISAVTARSRYRHARKAVIGRIVQASPREFHSIDVTDLIEESKELSPFLISHLKNKTDDLLKLPASVFEHLIAEFFASWGYSKVAVVGRDSWTGADVVAMQRQNRSGIWVRYFVEVKRWKERVGVEVVDRVLGAMMAERMKFGWHVGMIVGLGGFKNMRKYEPTALSLMGIELRDGTDVSQWLKDYQPSDHGLWLPDPFGLDAQLEYGPLGTLCALSKERA